MGGFNCRRYVQAAWSIAAVARRAGACRFGDWSNYFFALDSHWAERDLRRRVDAELKRARDQTKRLGAAVRAHANDQDKGLGGG